MQGSGLHLLLCVIQQGTMKDQSQMILLFLGNPVTRVGYEEWRIFNAFSYLRQPALQYSFNLVYSQVTITSECIACVCVYIYIYELQLNLSIWM
jgi:hypothetical protein